MWSDQLQSLHVLVYKILKFLKKDLFDLQSHEWKCLNFWPTSASQITMRGLDRYKSTRTLLPRRFECTTSSSVGREGTSWNEENFGFFDFVCSGVNAGFMSLIDKILKLNFHRYLQIKHERCSSQWCESGFVVSGFSLGQFQLACRASKLACRS